MADDVLTIKEAAAEAGVSLHVIYGAMKRGDLATVKPRRTLEHHIARAEFERWKASYKPRSRGGLRKKYQE